MCSFSDSSPRATYALPLLAGLHAVLELEDADELAPNWARVQGPDRYADSFYELFGSDDVFARGPVAQLLRDQDADDDTKASARALAAMQRARHLTPRGRVTTVANVGHELFDIVRIRHRANPNHSSVDFYRRAVGIALDYRASPAAGATAFTQTLELADWEAFN